MTDLIIQGGLKPAAIEPKQPEEGNQVGSNAFGSVLKDAIMDINK